MTVTDSSPASTNGGTASGTATTGAGTPDSGAGAKDFWDILGSVLPGVAREVAPNVGIDPRVAGQTVSQILGLFGIGGPGKSFAPAVSKDQAAKQLNAVVGPHLDDPAFAKALGKWLEAALQPAQAQKQGKTFQPPDLSKSWFSDAVDWIGDQASKVDWGRVAQVGMQALPYALALL